VRGEELAHHRVLTFICASAGVEPAPFSFSRFASAAITSRKVSTPTSRPPSSTISDPMSLSAMATTASATMESGATVKRVPPLTLRTSLTFMVLLLARKMMELRE
jgi:hypothetical protein